MSADSSMPKKIRVAVVGGGIGGLCFAIGLMRMPNIDFEIYEAAHKFSEIGAGVALAPNAQRAMQQISPDVTKAFDKLVLSNKWPQYEHVWQSVYVGQGPKAGKHIADIPLHGRNGFIHRAKFLDELVKLVPREKSHFGKRLEHVDDGADGEPMTLHFKDGTTATADCVVGCDGIHGKVREHVLGAGDPHIQSTYSSAVAYRMLAPMDKAIETIGEERAVNSFSYMGKGAFILTYPVDEFQRLNCVVIDMTRDAWQGPDMRKSDYEIIRERWADWDDTCKKIVSLFNDDAAKENMLWHHLDTPHYHRKNAVLMGDAAHATTPFQGQGAGQAIEDALVLAEVLGAVRDLKQLPVALHAFDTIRRPRGNKLVQTSIESGTMWALSRPNYMDDLDKIRDDLMTRMHWLWDEDIAAQTQDVKATFAQYVADSL